MHGTRFIFYNLNDGKDCSQGVYHNTTQKFFKKLKHERIHSKIDNFDITGIFPAWPGCGRYPFGTPEIVSIRQGSFGCEHVGLLLYGRNEQWGMDYHPGAIQLGNGRVREL